jgi:hypothetical protein
VDGPCPPDIAQLLRSGKTDEPEEIDAKRRRLFERAASTNAWRTSAPAASTFGMRNVAWVGLAALTVLVGTFAAGGTKRFGASARGASVDEPSNGASETDIGVAAEIVGIPAPRIPPATSIVGIPDPRMPPATSIVGIEATKTPHLAEDRARTTKNAPPLDTRRTRPSVEDELAAIDAVRSALGARAPDRALDRITRYRSTFTTPNFADEADTLEIQALAALGRVDQAREHAERFLEAHPNSPYKERVRAVAGLRGPID